MAAEFKSDPTNPPLFQRLAPQTTLQKPEYYAYFRYLQPYSATRLHNGGGASRRPSQKRITKLISSHRQIRASKDSKELITIEH